MTKNSAPNDVATARRERVASLRARGLSQREIVKALTDEGFKNPETNEAWGLVTICRDLKQLRNRQTKIADLETQQHMARQMADVLELKRIAWQTKDLKSVAKAIELEMKLTGTAVEKLDVNLKRKPESAEGMTDAELEATIAAGLAARRSTGATEETPGADQPA